MKKSVSLQDNTLYEGMSELEVLWKDSYHKATLDESLGMSRCKNVNLKNVITNFNNVYATIV